MVAEAAGRGFKSRQPEKIHPPQIYTDETQKKICENLCSPVAKFAVLIAGLFVPP